VCFRSVGCWVRAWVWGGLVWRVFRSARVPACPRALACLRTRVREEADGGDGRRTTLDRQTGAFHATSPSLCALARVLPRGGVPSVSPACVSSPVCLHTRDSPRVVRAREKILAFFFFARARGVRGLRPR